MNDQILIPDNGYRWYECKKTISGNFNSSNYYCRYDSIKKYIQVIVINHQWKIITFFENVSAYSFKNFYMLKDPKPIDMKPLMMEVITPLISISGYNYVIKSNVIFVNN